MHRLPPKATTLFIRCLHSCSFITLPWFLIPEPVSLRVHKRQKFAFQEPEQVLLPTLESAVSVVKAPGKRLCISQLWNPAIPTMGLTLLWVFYGASITHFQTRSPQVLPLSSISAPFLAMDREKGSHFGLQEEMGQNRRWPPLVYDLDTPVTKSMPPRRENWALTCPAFSLSQAQAEAGAHLRPRHLCRANIVVARGQRSCFVSPFALLQAHPAQWDRQEAVEDSGPVIEIW